jgi:hypothetical protein
MFESLWHLLHSLVVDEPHFTLMMYFKLQFQVYGGYFVVLGVVFGCMAVYTLSKKGTCKQKLWLPKEMVASESQA